jgi:hypothetical protein
MGIGQRYSAIISNDALATTGSLLMELITPATGVMRLLEMEGQSTDIPCVLSLTESPTITNGTTVIAPINRVRVNATVKPGTMIIYSDPAGISAGTVIERSLVGSASIVLENDYIALKKSTKYLVKLLNNSTGNVAAEIRIVWEEEV